MSMHCNAQYIDITDFQRYANFTITNDITPHILSIPLGNLIILTIFLLQSFSLFNTSKRPLHNISLINQGYRVSIT
jgi:hypothetical protein